MADNEVILKLDHISKTFGPVHALVDVNVEICKNEIHSILGQNGAGKSTLINILDNVYSYFGGDIYFEGKKIPRNEMSGYLNSMLGVVHQEFPLIPHMTVAENIFLDRSPKSRIKTINWTEMFKETQAQLDLMNVPVSAKSLVKDLTMAERQLVSIAHAMSKNPKVLIFDEATSALTESETELIFNLLRKLVKDGTAVIFISHKIEEIFSLCQKVTVLRDGVTIETVETANTSREDLIKMMAGKEITQQFPKRVSYCNKYNNEVLMKVDSLSGEGFSNCSFDVKKGEILGVAGLVGSGRPELIKTIFGAYKKNNGKIMLNGSEVNINRPKNAMDNGIFFVPSDRKKEGAFYKMSIVENTTIAFLDSIFSKFRWMNEKKKVKITKQYINELEIKVHSEEQYIGELSGGNQQKVIIARWLLGNGDIVMFEEPTRGLDVGVKYSLYMILNKLKSEGKGVVMISSELPELLAMSDRVIVMNSGRIVCELDNNKLSQGDVLRAMMQENSKVCEG